MAHRTIAPASELNQEADSSLQHQLMLKPSGGSEKERGERERERRGEREREREREKGMRERQRERREREERGREKEIERERERERERGRSTPHETHRDPAKFTIKKGNEGVFCFGLLCDQNARCPRNPAAVSLAKACSLWGLNTRPMAHRTIALASELKELQTPVQRSGRAETVGRPTSRSVHAASRPSASVRIPCWRL